MKISQLIHDLMMTQAEHGDLPVVFDNGMDTLTTIGKVEPAIHCRNKVVTLTHADVLGLAHVAPVAA